MKEMEVYEEGERVPASLFLTTAPVGRLEGVVVLTLQKRKEAQTGQSTWPVSSSW